MAVLIQQNTESTVIAENIDISLNCGDGNNARGRITAPALQKNHLLLLVCKKKILKVRQQLAEGIYDIGERLNVVLDHLLENLIGSDSTTDYLCPNADPLTIDLPASNKTQIGKCRR